MGIQEQRLAQQQVSGLLGQADKLVSKHLKVINEVIKASREAGEPPEKISAAIEPLLSDVESLSAAAGKDPAVIRMRVDALLVVPAAKDEPKVGSTVESIRARIARGDPLSASEKQVYADALRINRYDRMLLGYDKDDESATLPGGNALHLTARAYPNADREVSVGHRSNLQASRWPAGSVERLGIRGRRSVAVRD